jgi:hypothetical protein
VGERDFHWLRSESALASVPAALVINFVFVIIYTFNLNLFLKVEARINRINYPIFWTLY